MAFKGLNSIKPFEERLWLSSPTMHGPEANYMMQAYQMNWMSTVGENIDEVEAQIAELIGVKYAVALSSGTASLHLATKLAGERIYGQADHIKGALHNKTVFACDTTFAASINSIAYEGGKAVFIDTEYDTWNMDPIALERAFELFPETKLVVTAHLYGTPGKMKEIREICQKHGAFLIEDAAESLGAKYLLDGKWVETGTLGDFNCISFNGNKIITGSCGGMFLTNNIEDAQKVRKWSTQARESVPWYQHAEIGYNYRMSNVIAGVIRGQLPYLQEHIDQKKRIYERYEKGLADLPVSMNPFDAEKSMPNFWLSCLIIDKDAICEQVRSSKKASYIKTPGKSCPTEILEVLEMYNAEGRPIWKPMHLQPIYNKHEFITADERTDVPLDVGADIFERGLCLPSDNKMTEQQQNTVIDIIHSCFE